MLPGVLSAKVTVARLHYPVAFGWLSRWNQVLRAVADEISPAHLFQRFAQKGPVVGVVVAQKSLVQASLTEFFHGAQRLAVALDPLQGVHARVIHRRGGGHGRGIKSLYLVSPEAMLL